MAITRPFFKIASGLAKKPRSVAKRAMPLWKQNRKKIMEMEGKNISGQSLKRHGKPIKTDWAGRPEKPVPTWKPTPDSKKRAQHIINRPDRPASPTYKAPETYKRQSRKEESSYFKPKEEVPKARVSQKQLKRFLARGGSLRTAMDRMEPKGQPEDVTRMFTQPNMGEQQTKRGRELMPYDEGMSKYQASQSGMLKESPGGPSRFLEPDDTTQPLTKRLTPGEREPFQKQKIKSILPEFKRRRADSESAAMEIEMEAAEAVGKRKKVTDLKKRLGTASRGIVESMPIQQLVDAENKSKQLWKAATGGQGGKSVVGRWWKRASLSTRGRYKPKTAESHFNKVMFRWLADPEDTAKKYPREINDETFGIKTMWEYFGRE